MFLNAKGGNHSETDPFFNFVNLVLVCLIEMVQHSEEDKAGHDIRFCCKAQKFREPGPVRVAVGIRLANLRLNLRQDLLFHFSTKA